MEPRIQDPTALLPDVMKGVQYLTRAIGEGGVPQKTLELVHMRASQINGCSACVEFGLGAAARSGEALDRLVRLPAWRESDVFTDAERAALALAEAATRLADHPDVVTDEIWAEAARHFDEKGLATITLMVAMTNMFNRINTTLRVQATSARQHAAANSVA
jgi:AhpD family alkylhydroperoxidase